MHPVQQVQHKYWEQSWRRALAHPHPDSLFLGFVTGKVITGLVQSLALDAGLQDTARMLSAARSDVAFGGGRDRVQNCAQEDGLANNAVDDEEQLGAPGESDIV